jgi:hypothetical protein
VKLQVKERDTGRREVSFAAADAPLICDDDRERRIDIPALSLPYAGDGRFTGDYYARQANGDQIYYLVTARLRSAHRATGNLLLYDDPFDPPEGPYAPDCSTGGSGYPWWARR